MVYRFVNCCDNKDENVLNIGTHPPQNSLPVKKLKGNHRLPIPANF